MIQLSVLDVAHSNVTWFLPIFFLFFVFFSYKNAQPGFCVKCKFLEILCFPSPIFSSAKLEDLLRMSIATKTHFSDQIHRFNLHLSSNHHSMKFNFAFKISEIFLKQILVEHIYVFSFYFLYLSH